jgi:hypothetical protein
MVRHVRNIVILVSAILVFAWFPDLIKSNEFPVSQPAGLRAAINIFLEAHMFIVKMFHFIGWNNKPAVLTTILCMSVATYIVLVREKQSPSPVVKSTVSVVSKKDSENETIFAVMCVAGVLGILFIWGFAILIWGLGSGFSSWPLWFAGLVSVGIVAGLIAAGSALKIDGKSKQ